MFKSRKLRFLSKRFHNTLLPPRVKLSKAQKEAIINFNNKVNSGKYKFENIDCLCGSKESYDFASIDRFSIPTKTKFCLNCGLFRISPRLDSKSNNLFYKFDYRPIYVGSASAGNEFFNLQVRQGKKILSYIENNFKLKKNSVVYEVGCGAGGILVPFQESGHRVFGCDLGKEYLEYGIKKGLDLSCGDVETLFEKPKANLIILSHVLEHFMNPFEEIKKMKKLMQKGGIIYIELPGARESYKQFGGDPLVYFQNAHLFNFTLENLTYFMHKEGFRLLEGTQAIQAIFINDENPTNYKIDLKTKELITYLNYHEFLRAVGFPVGLLYPKTFIKNYLVKLIGKNKFLKLKSILKS